MAAVVADGHAPVWQPSLLCEFAPDVIVSGIWLWLVELRQRYPGIDLVEWFLEALASDHEQVGFKLVSQPIVGLDKKAMSRVTNALLVTPIVVLHNIAKRFNLVPWWLRYSQALAVATDCHVDDCRLMVERCGLVENAAGSTANVPGCYLPFDPFANVNPLLVAA